LISGWGTKISVKRELKAEESQVPESKKITPRQIVFKEGMKNHIFEAVWTLGQSKNYSAGIKKKVGVQRERRKGENCLHGRWRGGLEEWESDKTKE